MLNGKYCQLVVSVSSPAGDITCMMSPFETVPYAPDNGRYMNFRWLQRCDHFSLESVAQIDRREHLMQFEGRAAREVGDVYPYYLVNSGRFYEEDKDKARKIFCKCTTRSCSGRAPRPSAGLGPKVACPECSHEFLWY